MIGYVGKPPPSWPLVPLRFLLSRRVSRNQADAELLSVYRDHGVIPKSSRDDNHNRDGNDLSTYLHVQRGDLVINKMKAWQGSLAVSAYDGIVSPAYFVFSVRSSIDGRYLHHLLRSSSYVQELARISSGVRPGQWDLDLAEFGRILVPLPPLPVQRAIAGLLDRKTTAIDGLIGKKERLVALLGERWTALVHGVITKGLNPRASLRKTNIDWIGEIPTHWDLKRLKRISPAQGVGVVVNPSSYVDPLGTVPFIYGSDVSPGLIDTSNARLISVESNRQLVSSQLRAGDLVVVRVGAPGITAVVPPTLDRVNCASVMIVRRSQLFDSTWLEFALNSPVGKAGVEIVAYGAAQKQFNISHAVDFVFPVPPLAEQRQIVESLITQNAAFSAAAARIKRQLEHLREYRQAFITAAVTGQLGAKDTSP